MYYYVFMPKINKLMMIIIIIIIIIIIDNNNNKNNNNNVYFKNEMEKGSAMFLCSDTKAGCLNGSSTGWSIFSDKKSYFS